MKVGMVKKKFWRERVDETDSGLAENLWNIGERAKTRIYKRGSKQKLRFVRSGWGKRKLSEDFPVGKRADL